MADPTQTLTTATQVIDQLVQQTKQAVTTYGPNAYGLAIDYIHWSAIFNTVVDLGWLIFSIILFATSLIVFLKTANIMKLYFEEHEDPEQFHPGYIICIGCAFGLIISTIIFVSSFSDILSTDNLMGLFAPKLGLVNHVLSALTPSAPAN